MNRSVDRRTFLKATGATGAMAVGLGAGVAGSAAGNIAEFQQLTTSSDQRIVDESGNTVRLRGLNVPDPKRVAKSEPVRGKSMDNILNMLTNNEKGWHPRVIRIPAQPGDIGEHRIGAAGPQYEDGELANPDAVADDRQKQVPPPVPAFDRDDLRDYIDNYYRPAVEKCKERGVYCIIEYHRHWHEQPPGTEDPSGAENHLPYNDDYTCYWAYNTHDAFGEDAPGSWGWVDQKTINDLTPGASGWTGWTSWDDAPGPADNPYHYDNWQINEELLDEVLMFWDMMLEEFGDMEHVIVEPYNEPTAPGIWGPVDGCGSWKQKHLWRTYMEDFAQPMLEKVREYQPERLIMMGVPGWDQAVQGLHWSDFGDLGFDNIAVTWHNYAGHDVSQLSNWFNDTSYEAWGDIEDRLQAEGYSDAELTDPYLNPPNWPDGGPHPDMPECWGWEGYEAAGLQNAMDYHPIAVTEFGWIDDEDASHWLRGDTTGQGDTNTYGKPFVNTIEQDERISWVHWCADVRWLPAMFKVTWEVGEGEVLTNKNWYETDVEALDDKFKCPNELPCDWELVGNPNSGQYIKNKLEELATDNVPFDLETHGDGETTEETTDGTGKVYDVNQNGKIDFPDVNELFQMSDSTSAAKYDYDDNGEVNLQDVLTLFDKV